jgi:hypothetical protein
MSTTNRERLTPPPAREDGAAASATIPGDLQSADGDHPMTVEEAPAAASLPQGVIEATGEENPSVNLGRIGWLVTVLACLVAVLILVLEGYYGYAGVTFAVAVSAAINL